MQVILVGLNHKTAPVEVREQMAFDTRATEDGLRRLKEQYPSGEFVLLSTCNRVECYAAVKREDGPSADELGVFLSQLRGVDHEKVSSHFYIYTGEEVVRHLMTVASSLDSMIVGENQIITQVKESFKLASRVQSSGKILNHLFHIAFHTTKEIFSTTSISKRRISVAGVAVELARQLFSDIQSAKIVVTGAGEMGELLVEHFQHIKCKDITVVNRSEERGCKVAKKHNIVYKPWDQLDDEIAAANIVLGAATAQDGFLFNKSQFKKIMARRRNKLLLAIDITVPRSFDPAINDIDSVYLYSIDDLGKVVEDNIKLREGDLEQAVEIVCKHVTEFTDWFESRDIGPLVGQIKNAFEQIRDNELDKFFTGERQHAECKAQLELSVRNVVNKLLHCVVKNIDNVAKEQGASEAQQFAKGIVEHAEDIICEIRTKENNQ
jgi:glutamyl-tRNA reductase